MPSGLRSGCGRSANSTARVRFHASAAGGRAITDRAASKKDRRVMANLPTASGRRGLRRLRRRAHAHGRIFVEGAGVLELSGRAEYEPVSSAIELQVLL